MNPFLRCCLKFCWTFGATKCGSDSALFRRSHCENAYVGAKQKTTFNRLLNTIWKSLLTKRRKKYFDIEFLHHYGWHNYILFTMLCTICIKAICLQ